MYGNYRKATKLERRNAKRTEMSYVVLMSRLVSRFSAEFKTKHIENVYARRTNIRRRHLMNVNEPCGEISSHGVSAMGKGKQSRWSPMDERKTKALCDSQGRIHLILELPTTFAFELFFSLFAAVRRAKADLLKSQRDAYLSYETT